ncbi:MAG: hypothetical protein N3B13_09670, partial [Deltaproteobacteria bacterium]|nr:hypothetical protein [Deltaproteobacteria bacterium]
MFLIMINFLNFILAETAIPVFSDITSDVLISDIPSGSFMSVRDYNGDRLSDILIDNRLYKNISYFGTYFYDATEEAGLKEAKGHGTFIDFDDDSCPDLIFYGQNYSIEVYRNTCKGVFEKVENLKGFENCIHTEAVGFIPHKYFRYPLIYCADYEYRGEYFRDFLYVSNGDFSFYDVS